MSFERRDKMPKGWPQVWEKMCKASFERRDKMPKGSVILAHNSGNAASKLEHYLTFVRDAKNCAASVNCLLDIEGLEVTKK